MLFNDEQSPLLISIEIDKEKNATVKFRGMLQELDLAHRTCEIYLPDGDSLTCSFATKLDREVLFSLGLRVQVTCTATTYFIMGDIHVTDLKLQALEPVTENARDSLNYTRRLRGKTPLLEDEEPQLLVFAPTDEDEGESAEQETDVEGENWLGCQSSAANLGVGANRIRPRATQQYPSAISLTIYDLMIAARPYVLNPSSLIL